MPLRLMRVAGLTSSATCFTPTGRQCRQGDQQEKCKLGLSATIVAIGARAAHAGISRILYIDRHRYRVY